MDPNAIVAVDMPTTKPDISVKSKHWTIREAETAISHQKLLGTGGFGEVHEVSFLLWILTFETVVRYRDRKGIPLSVSVVGTS